MTLFKEYINMKYNLQIRTFQSKQDYVDITFEGTKFAPVKGLLDLKKKILPIENLLIFHPFIYYISDEKNHTE